MQHVCISPRTVGHICFYIFVPILCLLVSPLFAKYRIGAPLTLQFGQDLSSYHEPGYEQGWSVPLDVHFAYTAPNRWTLAENLPRGLF